MRSDLYRLADRRYGLLTRADLEATGLSAGAIARLVENGELVRLHRSVYRLPGAPRTSEQTALAACMAIGPHSWASHTTAGGLWQISQAGSLPEVVVPRAHRSQQKTIVVHRSLNVARNEVTRIGIIPVTRVARTLADLASRLSSDDLEDALDEALRRRLVTPEQLVRYPRLRKLAEDRRGRGVPRNKLERRAIAALKQAGLPDPVRQHRVRIRGNTYYPDLCYPARRISIELEGEAPHWGKTRWQYDHDRDNDFELDGWRVLTYTWDDATTGSLKLILQVGEILGLRPTRWSAR